MILGIVALVLVCIWWIAIPCSIVGLILGMVARGKAARGEAGGSGMATAGIVCSMCSLALYLLLLVLGISFLAALSR